jgi:hypothetical protein
MKLKSLLPLLVVSVLALTGCSSAPAKVDKGTINARTFSFVARPNRPVPIGAENRTPIHTMVQAAIAKNLAARGVTQVPSGGDVTVGYLIVTGNNATTSTINDYFGYGEDASGLEDKAHKAYTENKNPNYFEAGTLLIDIVDTKTYKLLNRNYATRELLKNASESTRVERLQGVVDEILNGVRIKP